MDEKNPIVEVEAVRGFFIRKPDGAMEHVPPFTDKEKKKPSRVRVRMNLARQLVQANKARFVETAAQKAPENAAGGARG